MKVFKLLYVSLVSFASAVSLSDIVLPPGGSTVVGGEKITCESSSSDIPLLRLGTYTAVSGCSRNVWTVTFASSKAVLLESNDKREFSYVCSGKSCYFDGEGQKELILKLVDRSTFRKLVSQQNWCLYKLQN